MLSRLGWTEFALCILLPLYLLYLVQRWIALRVSIKIPPLGWSKVPYIGHSLSFLRGGAELHSMFEPYRKTTTPIHFNICGTDLFLINSPEIVKKIANKPHIFTEGALRGDFALKVLDLPKSAAQVLGNDNSGSALRPLPGSSLPPERRIVRMQHETTFNLLTSPSGIHMFVLQFTNFMEKLILSNGIGEQWVELPDLFHFIQNLTSTAMMNALCGPRLVGMNSDFVNEFWTFDLNIHYLNLGIARLFRPEGVNARDRCIKALIEWKKNAIQDSVDKDYPESLLWDETWGFKIMRDRDDMYSRFPEYCNDQARAGADLGILWACNDNLIPVGFWLVQRILNSPSLRERFMKAFDNARLPSQPGDILPRFNTHILAKTPFLQSTYHEVLRTQVTSFTARTVREDCQIGEYMFPKGSVILSSSWGVHNNPGLWESRPGAQEHPVEEFWPERFLVCPYERAAREGKSFPESEKDPEFSLKGLDGTFFPFGMGHNACPGRHFATHAILNIAATMLSVFEFEPIDTWAGEGMDYTTFGYTPARPLKKIPFRIRRKLLPVVVKDGCRC
ncbi:hypothetical protein H112_05086 [Trichophyton rubrum D6]|uniref:Cytochrome P450 n=2 Tax=Trichophyton TaxID=5550 RepID=A0A022W017_TRIRU|nr:hypothetical protein H100_05110 [Trichophyton rubrum MR850]EZF41086.1 hypothetical protein H102_05095 [Trichophyton rubrum CBS 100081]EZF51592.1 hypothetical protein H103_05097 [Trichophyton rubrum CBS 288.86]EZF62338.1 hypothetical protein H104_05091 [Trichophyton rubrum CBS 289.86]EZF72837.1 hypothetical protein H105_05117 [Trichophyton soudanense CBS 452.61]EZF83552.1 hypothetical protein H110_05096 [Trichophyton rubrum MR1448]EZG15894.1 hypothetical protein H107_05227 [Trichophyton rub